MLIKIRIMTAMFILAAVLAFGAKLAMQNFSEQMLGDKISKGLFNEIQ